MGLLGRTGTDTVGGGVGAWRQGPVGGNAHTRSASKRRRPAQFRQLGCPTTEHDATLQESSPSPAEDWVTGPREFLHG